MDREYFTSLRQQARRRLRAHLELATKEIRDAVRRDVDSALLSVRQSEEALTSRYRRQGRVPGAPPTLVERVCVCVRATSLEQKPSWGQLRREIPEGFRARKSLW